MLTVLLILATVISWFAGVLMLIRPIGEVQPDWLMPTGIGSILFGVACLAILIRKEGNHGKLKGGNEVYDQILRALHDVKDDHERAEGKISWLD